MSRRDAGSTGRCDLGGGWLCRVGLPAMLVSGLLAFPVPAGAEKIAAPVAVFAALDKVTARISKLEVKLNDTVQFGTLKVTPRSCFVRPPTEPPLTTAFVEVEDIKLDGSEQRIFTGWMFAQSPGLHAVEHPVFDVWLTDCADPEGLALEAGTTEGGDQSGTKPAKKRRAKRN